MNDDASKPPACIIRLAIVSITVLASLCAVLGCFLCWKGYSGGDVLIGVSGTAVGGLVGMISMRNASAGNGEPPKP